MLTCPACGLRSSEELRFCGRCGTALTVGVGTGREVRKTVTVVFCDLAGSTALGERLDPESLQGVLGRYYERMREVLERHRGTVQKFIGDAVVGVFGVPTLHEDDALRAVRAAVELGAALAALNEELMRNWGVTLQLRGGVNTGEVVAGSPATGSALVLGDAVNVAARLEQAAAPGEILLGRTTWELVRNAVTAEPIPPLAVKGKAEPVSAWRLLAVTADAPGSKRRRRDVPMVGREPQRRVLLDTFDEVVAERACRLVTVLGAAGVGKSRLVDEVLAGLGERAAVVRGRCLSYGEGIAWWPVAEVVRQAAGIAHDDARRVAVDKLAALVADQEHPQWIASRIAATVGLADATGGPEEASWALRKLLESLARNRPLVAAFDDLHWAEPPLLDLVEYLPNFSRDAPILVVSLARTELLDTRPDWGRSVQGAATVRLEPLSAAESEQLVDQLLGTDPLERRAAARITGQAGGNPLFIEELVAKLLDDGLLRHDDGRWVASPALERAATPATIQVLLAARLEQLPGEERAVLERASVVGKTFSWAAVAALTPGPERTRLGSDLAALVRRDLLRPDTSERADEDAFQFRHDLIRDAAYQALPKRERAELHERLATWVQGTAGERLAERLELVGYHLEQAYRTRVELGPPDDHAQGLAQAAAEQLGAAGQRALARDDAPSAVNLLGRAVSLVPAADPERAGLMAGLGVALMDTAELERADAVLAEAATIASGGGDERLAVRASLDRAWLRFLIRPEAGIVEVATRQAQQAIARLTELDDDLGLARAWLLLSAVRWLQCRFAAAGEAAEHVVRHARRAGNVRDLRQGVGDFVQALRFGPTPVGDGLRRCEELREQLAGDRYAELTIDDTILGLLALQGRFADARALYGQVRAIVSDLGLDWAWPFGPGHWQRARMERLAGDLATAERELRLVFDAHKQAGDEGHLVSSSVELADVLVEQGRDDEALRLTEVSEAGAAPDDLAAQLVWRRVRAKVLARRGDAIPAEQLARAAVALAERTDWLEGQGDALADLGEVQRLAGKPREAVEALRAALARYEQKGAVALADRVRTALG
jgi:class 3 adenylate cyclase/tetratricopeptide (TPR) repeat protein